MATVGHLVAGLVAARLRPPPRDMPRSSWAVLLVALAFLPDADVIAFAMGIPYSAPFGHRGAAHSLLAAGTVGLLVALTLRKAPRLGTAVVVFTAVASHGLLDTLTDGGLGIALLWPWSTERFFAPWRPIPVAPIGAGLLSARGLRVLLVETLLFLPLLPFAFWPPKRETR